MAAWFVRFPGGPRPDCNRQLDGAFQGWAMESKSTNGTYPNLNGDSAACIAVIEPFIGNGKHGQLDAYGYVPGLRFDDPTNVVLIYMKEKTRFTWHSDYSHTLFSPRKWYVNSPSLVESGTCPEGGDLLDTPEFKKRLLATLDFLRTNNRPNWEIVAREQLAFLASIK